MIAPSPEQFRELSRRGLSVPVALRLDLDATPRELFRAAGFDAPCLLLESARLHPVTGRWSLLAGEPEAILTAKNGLAALRSRDGRSRPVEGNPLELLQRMLDRRPVPKLPGLPPFTGGAVGFLGFDAYRYIEEMPAVAQDDLGLPDMGFLFCDEAVMADHLLNRLWVIALADPAQPDAYERAVAKVHQLAARLLRPAPPADGDRRSPMEPSLPLCSTHTRESFAGMVREAKRFIADGDIYQANLSQRFTVPLTEPAWTLYDRLQRINPSPFSAYADFSATGGSANPFGGGFQVISSSPERLLRLSGGTAETRPIAGTRPRGRSAEETRAMREALLLNEKERAEHLMLVDLERNDLGRVCRYGSVEVDALMELEDYSHVIHIVSNVRGELRPGVTPAAAVRALFPGGTITGCPKIRSIQIIDALEPVRRQLYTGSIGYIGYNGEADLNILIRTGIACGGSVHVQAGAGIVADSDPGREYEETLHKARAMVEAFHAEPVDADGPLARAATA